MQIEAYRVGVSLLMDAGISSQLSAIIAQFEKLDAVVNKVNAGTKGMADVLKGMTTLTAGVGGVAVASEKMAKAASDIAKVMPDTARQAEATASAMERAASAGQRLQGPAIYGAPGYTPYGYRADGQPEGSPIRLPHSPPPGGFVLGPGGPAMPSGPGYGVPAPYVPWSDYAGGPGPHTAYAPGGPFVPYGAYGPHTGPTPDASFFEGERMPLNLREGVGGGVGGRGGGLVSAMYTIDMGVHMVERFMALLGKAIDQAVQMNTEMTRLHLGGVSEPDRELLKSNAYDVAKLVPGRTTAQILEDTIAMRANLGDEAGNDKTAAVRAMMPTAEKAALLLKAATGEDSPEALARLYKAVELRGDVVDPKTGQVSPERFAAGLDAALDVLILGHGQVKTNDLFNLAKQSSGAMRLVEDPYSAWSSVMTPMMELGGSRTGTGLTAAMRSLLGGTMAKHYAEEMIATGMAKPGATYEQLFPPAGRNGAVQFNKDFIVDPEVLEKEGLRAWIDDVAKKKLAEHGITSQDEITKESYRLMNTETYRRVALIYLTQGAQVNRDIELYKGVPGFDEKYNILRNESAENAAAGLKASVTNFAGALGDGALPVTMGVEKTLGKSVDVLTDATREGGGFLSNLFSGHPFGPGSHWFSPADSAAPVVDTHTPITMKGDVNLDGKKIGDFTASRMADQGSLPSAAPTGGDPRNTAPQPGWSWQLQ